MPINSKDYPPDWKDKIRPRILKRDHYMCKFCGVHHKAIGYRDYSGAFIECDELMIAWAKKALKRVFTIYLSVAHTCHDKKCEKDTHLVSLCQKCHLNLDRPYKLGKRISTGCAPQEHNQ